MNAGVPRLSIGDATPGQVVAGNHPGAEIEASDAEDIWKGKIGQREGGKRL